MGLALHNYHDAMSVFPPGYIAAGPFIDGETDVSPGWSWASMILPQLDQSPLYSSINFWLPVAAPANTTATQTSLSVFFCPSDQIPGRTFAVTDGFGNTVATVAPSSYADCTGSDAADVATGLNNDGWEMACFSATATFESRRSSMGPARPCCCWNAPGEIRRGPGPARFPGAISCAGR